MTEMNAENLAMLQKKWTAANSGIFSRSAQYLGDVDKVKKTLGEMGLDLTQDETYEMLAPDLTKGAFDKQHAYLCMLWVLDGYHSMQAQRHDYVNVMAGRHYYGLKELLQNRLPKFEEAYAKAGLPDESEINPLHMREIKFIRQLHKEGLLEKELKQAALEAAYEDFRSAQTLKNDVEERIAKGEHYYRDSCEGLSYADRTLKLIKVADDNYAPKDIPAEYDFMGGWDEKKGTIHFSRENAEAQRTYFLVKELGVKFSEAKDWQDKGEFVLDASGSGHGVMVMPMQDIALKLESYGYDLKDPATYPVIGTDIKTFSKAYKDERKAVAKNDKYNLIKPALKI